MNNFHIGDRIRNKMKEDGRIEKWLADKIHCAPSKITRICQTKSIDTNILADICIHLEYNFFEDYVKYVNNQLQLDHISVEYFFINDQIHIGKFIRRIKKEKGIKANWLAEKVAYSEENLQKIYKHENMDIERLIKFCIHLKFNFFNLYTSYVDEQIKKKKQGI